MGENNVRSYFSKLEKEKKEREKRSKGGDKRLTVVLSDYDFRRLKYIAKHFGELNSVFARNIILEALADAEKFLDLEEYDNDFPIFYTDEDGEQKVEFDLSSYGQYINGISSTEEDEEEDGGSDNQSEVSATERKKRTIKLKKESSND